MRTTRITLTLSLLSGLGASPALAQQILPTPDPAPTAPPAVEPAAAPAPDQPAPASTAPVVVAQAGTAAPSSASSVAAPAAELKAQAPAPVSAAGPTKATSLLDALVGGKIGASVRYRFEYLDRQDLPLHARASTMRLTLGYETKPLYGLSVFAQFEGVTNLGEKDWRLPSADPAANEGDRPRRPPVADPVGNELNQAYLKYASKYLTMKLGRQDVALNNARFISVSPWRQSNQTIDAAAVDLTPLPGLGATYMFLGRVNRVIGTGAKDGSLEMKSHVGNLTYKRVGIVQIALYDLYLDYEDLPLLSIDAAGMPRRAPDGSTNSFGARVEGPLKLSDTWSLLYALDVARQVDIAENPLEVKANYLQLEAGLAYKGFGLRTIYSSRGGAKDPVKGNSFQTPLAHPWDGWTENFLVTPKTGLRFVAGALAGPVPGVEGLTFTSAYYEYFGETNSDHYGREVDFGIEYRFVKIDKNWTLGNRFAYYMGDELTADKLPSGAANLRTSVYTMYAF
jgi:hypothetical protein